MSTMPVAQLLNQRFPFWRGCIPWLSLTRIHLEQQGRAIKVVRIAWWSNDIGWQCRLLDQICREPAIRLQASNIFCQVTKNKQGDIFSAVGTLLETGCNLTQRDASVLFDQAIKRVECLYIACS